MFQVGATVLVLLGYQRFIWVVVYEPYVLYIYIYERTRTGWRIFPTERTEKIIIKSKISVTQFVSNNRALQFTAVNYTHDKTKETTPSFPLGNVCNLGKISEGL